MYITNAPFYCTLWGLTAQCTKYIYILIAQYLFLTMHYWNANQKCKFIIYIGMSDPSMYNNLFTFSLYISNGTENVNFFSRQNSASWRYWILYFTLKFISRWSINMVAFSDRVIWLTKWFFHNVRCQAFADRRHKRL